MADAAQGAAGAVFMLAAAAARRAAGLGGAVCTVLGVRRMRGMGAHFIHLPPGAQEPAKQAVRKA